MFWCYMLHCRGGYFYIGHTDDLERRIGQIGDGPGGPRSGPDIGEDLRHHGIHGGELALGSGELEKVHTLGLAGHEVIENACLGVLGE